MHILFTIEEQYSHPIGYQPGGAWSRWDRTDDGIVYGVVKELPRAKHTTAFIVGNVLRKTTHTSSIRTSDNIRSRIYMTVRLLAENEVDALTAEYAKTPTPAHLEDYVTRLMRYGAPLHEGVEEAQGKVVESLYPKALDASIAMWEWLAQCGTRKKENFPRYCDDSPSFVGTGRPICDCECECTLCDIFHTINKGCAGCPLNQRCANSQKGEACGGGAYNEWNSAQVELHILDKRAGERHPLSPDDERDYKLAREELILKSATNARAIAKTLYAARDAHWEATKKSFVYRAIARCIGLWSFLAESGGRKEQWTFSYRLAGVTSNCWLCDEFSDRNCRDCPLNIEKRVVNNEDVLQYGICAGGAYAEWHNALYKGHGLKNLSYNERRALAMTQAKRILRELEMAFDREAKLPENQGGLE